MKCFELQGPDGIEGRSRWFSAASFGLIGHQTVRTIPLPVAMSDQRCEGNRVQYAKG